MPRPPNNPPKKAPHNATGNIILPATVKPTPIVITKPKWPRFLAVYSSLITLLAKTDLIANAKITYYMIIPITGSRAANTANTPKETTVYPAFFILSSQGISSSKQSTIKQPNPIPKAFAPMSLALVPYLIGFFGALNFLNLKTVFLNS